MTRRSSDATSEAAWMAEARQTLIAAGAYDPADEHDACGVGLVAAIDGRPRREIVTLALAALKNVWHRGAVDADGKTGDGAGLRLDVPDSFFRAEVARTGHEPRPGPVGVGMVFLPRKDLRAQDGARTIVESEILRAGLYLYGWRQVPVRPKIIGEKAEFNRPQIEQVLFHDPDGRDFETIERDLFLIRRRIERRAEKEGVPELYVCSLSTRTLVYKGMFLAEQIQSFFPDLAEDDFVSRACVFHQRYSTNTFPEWRLAQPFRILAHNGEINTLKGNVNWMTSHEIGLCEDAFGEHAADARPIIQRGSSDSAALDQAYEMLVRGGRDPALAKVILMPEAWSKRQERMPKARRDLYAYCNAVMEPWDGPAAVVACDGRWAVAGLDRNGLRPARWAQTVDGVLAVGSEAGMCPIEEERIARRGSIAPGGMIGVDLARGALYVDDDLVDHVAERHPFGKWIAKTRDVEPEIGPGDEPLLFPPDARVRRLAAAGLSREDLEVVLAPMINEKREAIGSMGDDTPLAVLSTRYRPLSHYFRQNFSQVTNPPIDPLREGRVMSLRTRFYNLAATRAADGPQPEILSLDGPILTNGMFARLAEALAATTARIDCTFARPDDAGSGRALRAVIDRVCDAASAAVQAGASHLVLDDAGQGPERAPAPMILAVSAVHRRLLGEGLRRSCALTVRSAECFDAHHAAVLIGVGATCVNPYLAFEAAADRVGRGLHPGETARGATGAVKQALEGGLLKILSKMGIAIISSYRGGCNFDALGLSRSLTAEFFPGAANRLSGIGLPGLEAKLLALHAQAWRGPGRLAVGGFYKQRASGEAHAIEARVVAALQEAVRNEDRAAYDRYVEALGDQAPIQLRDLVEPRPAGPEVSIHDVESTNEIRKRFVTPGMSLGALSPEAHGTLNIAMNRIGARSVSGEGGEDPARYTRRANGDNANSAVKQVASGRFGVTAEYLNQAREIEIKIAQGAKPGEGGQLPGYKVNDFIARMRHATPGVSLISPPPHHDIYSIEDLAQLIYDLKQINPEARVCVKLVSTAGVGTIAAGVAKAKADVILISGHVGGTGASPQTSIKFAGAPWEMGVAEAHQILTLNKLRDQVCLRTDGGIRTGRDVVIAAMLGAEEYGIGTISLIAMGCLMVRQCHTNTCPVGVCTQDESLRDRFTGAPEHVVRLMTFIADEVREILARLGAGSLDDVIGRADLLAQVSRGDDHLDDLDFNPLLARIDPTWRPPARERPRVDVPETLDTAILRDAAPVFERGEKMQLSYTVRNVQRAIGARVSSHIVRAHGAAGLPDGQLTVRLRGSTGQSLGAFGANGLRLEVDGEANDYVGKGLSGAEIIVASRSAVADGAKPHDDVLVGNTCLYGATSGVLFAAGRAGERFAVRNSGARAVVEGVSANGCEYMTGGVVVVLGGVGDNFAAGMTGGEAFVYDPEGLLPAATNRDTVLLGRFADADASDRCRDLVAAHADATGSVFARRLIENWDVERGRFVHVLPREIAARDGITLDEVA